MNLNKKYFAGLLKVQGVCVIKKYWNIKTMKGGCDEYESKRCGYGNFGK
jgi:hypothetical protein